MTNGEKIVAFNFFFHLAMSNASYKSQPKTTCRIPKDGLLQWFVCQVSLWTRLYDNYFTVKIILKQLKDKDFISYVL